jgi:hypothetical protein
MIAPSHQTRYCVLFRTRKRPFEIFLEIYQCLVDFYFAVKVIMIKSRPRCRAR